MSQAPATQNTQATTALPAPDRARGLFETLLILEGEPVELDAHLERLAASLRELFAAPPPGNLSERIVAAARGLELGRMRIDVAPTDRLRARGEATPVTATLRTQPVDLPDFFPSHERGAALRSVFADGGLGRHKWADRRPLGEVAGTPVPLLFDSDDELLEAGRANVFAVIGQVLVTPRADRRILPGIARAGAIAVARDEGVEVRERRLGREQLFAADEVFLTGSVRGVEPARSLDQTELPSSGELSRRIGEGLRLRWRTGRLAAAGS